MNVRRNPTAFATIQRPIALRGKQVNWTGGIALHSNGRWANVELVSLCRFLFRGDNPRLRVPR